MAIDGGLDFAFEAGVACALENDVASADRASVVVKAARAFLIAET